MSLLVLTISELAHAHLFMSRLKKHSSLFHLFISCKTLLRHVPYFCLQDFYKDPDDLFNKYFLFIKMCSIKSHLAYLNLERFIRNLKPQSTFKSPLFSTAITLCTKANISPGSQNKATYGQRKKMEHLCILWHLF